MPIGGAIAPPLATLVLSVRPCLHQEFPQEILIIFYNFLGGDINLPLRQKMRNICIKNMRQIFRNFSEMCIGKFWNFCWHFYASTENMPSRDNFCKNYGKLCWKKYQKFLIFLPLNSEGIFVLHVTLGQTCRKKLVFMT